MTTSATPSILDLSAIRRVTFYQAAPVETCDRCGQGIKYVFAVTYKDDTVQRYGSECINKILAGEPNLRKLFSANSKKLARYQGYLEVLSRPVEDMPRGSEYYGSGLYMIADSEGKDISFQHYYFHPIYDVTKNLNGRNYVVKDPAKHVGQCMKEIEAAKPKLTAEIARLEGFLAKILRSVKKEEQ